MRQKGAIFSDCLRAKGWIGGCRSRQVTVVSLRIGFGGRLRHSRERTNAGNSQLRMNELDHARMVVREVLVRHDIPASSTLNEQIPELVGRKTFRKQGTQLVMQLEEALGIFPPKY